MMFLEILTIVLLLLLLVRSINHDNRMARLEKFVSNVVTAVKQREGIMSDHMFSDETIDNPEDVTEVDDGGKEGSVTEAKEREDL